jgi:hypothetical protein
VPSFLIIALVMWALVAGVGLILWWAFDHRQ